ncbi:MAG TPA: protein kinase [Pyrinomonadaceae bacterium]|jgi:tetratricopeptide (TPR) repeat protein/tRNA A-37 threonylcarbamoyl transferase component Bud32
MIGKTISHYRILGQVGEGGMGVVYVAEDLHLGRRVAIKIPHAGRDESHYRARFLREARSVSKLRHPNIAAVHDYGETDAGQPFIVMELVSGQTLGDVLAGPGLSIARAVEVACQTAEALSEAHRRGVVHRDIKPSNVVIDENGDVKVLDFGLAKQLHEEAAGAGGAEAQTLLSAHTRSDVVIGTPLYLSPEQARGSKVDGRSDLFALGALLYECLTGRPAFSGANVIEIGAQVLHFDPPPPSRFNPRVPAELDRLTLRALSKKPEDRFQTAAEFAAELSRVRSRLPASDTATTRRLTGADNGYTHRSSALITMAEGLRRPKFSPLTLLASLAGLALLIWAVWYWQRPPVYKPGPEAARLYGQGVDAMREGSYYKASDLFRQAVQREEKFALAHARLAEALMEMDSLDLALAEMMNVTRLAPDFKVYPRADALYLEALHATLNREYAAAAESYRKIIALDPGSPQAHLDLGRAYEKDNQTQKAVQSYTEATSKDNSYAAAFLRLGILLARQGNQAGATNNFDRAQRLFAEQRNKEGEAAVRYQRGRLFFNNKKPVEARAEFEQALRLAEETKNAYQRVVTLLQLAQTQEDLAQAQKTAQAAFELAQNSGMSDQVANGHITGGNLLFSRGDLEGAERAYEQARIYAGNFKLRRYEALAYANLAGVREKQRRLDEADQMLEKARSFFIQGGYRREADQQAIVLARIKKRRGDYGGALRLLEEQLGLAEQSGDVGLTGTIHQECGSVLISQEKYAEALKHYGESSKTFRHLRNQQQLTYSLLNMAGALYSLGRYEEAVGLLGELAGAGPETLGVGMDIVAAVHLNLADLELTRLRFREAAEHVRRALAVMKDGNVRSDVMLAWADSDLGLAEARGGAAARGLALCEGAARLASASKDEVLAARVHYSLALALLEAGDPRGARAAALHAQEIFARVGRADSDWRALAVAGKASRRAGDETAAREYLARAASSLKQVEQSLGAEAGGYLSRPDVTWLRGDFGVSTASASR